MKTRKPAASVILGSYLNQRKRLRARMAWLDGEIAHFRKVYKKAKPTKKDWDRPPAPEI